MYHAYAYAYSVYVYVWVRICFIERYGPPVPEGGFLHRGRGNEGVLRSPPSIIPGVTLTQSEERERGRGDKK